MKFLSTVALLAATICCFAETDLEKRVSKLEKELAALKQQIKQFTRKPQATDTLQQLRAAARQRMRADLKNYPVSDLTFIEKLINRLPENGAQRNALKNSQN